MPTMKDSGRTAPVRKRLRRAIESGHSLTVAVRFFFKIPLNVKETA